MIKMIPNVNDSTNYTHK